MPPRLEEIPWQRVWRVALAPLLSTPGLCALRRALERDDPALLQGTTVSPPPLRCYEDEPVEAACALAFCAWQGDGLDTVGAVETSFARLCQAADEALGAPAASRAFFSWADDVSRAEFRRGLLEEVSRTLSGRAATPPVPGPGQPAPEERPGRPPAA